MDRLVAILIALQQRPETAQALADKFEVSRRTILRDMQALAEMGVPIYAEAGPAGGFRLMEGYRLPPLQFDSREAITLLFALRALARLADTPFREARWTAIDKIRAVLPKKMLESIEPVLERVEFAVPERKARAPHLPELMEHAAASRWIRVRYRSERHDRVLELLPRRIYAAHGFWYCEAYSPLHGEVRTFRADRMASVEAIEAPAPGGQGGANDGRDGADRQDGADGRDDASRRGPSERRKSARGGRAAAPSVRIVARLTRRGALLAEQDEHIGERVRQIADDEWEVDFRCPAEEWNWAARFFFTLGTDAEVKEPERLRREIFDMARRLCERYGRPGGKAQGAEG
jgi:predicted DNA-binding transcriptional regulator YafY